MQNYNNHRRYNTSFHFILLPIVFIGIGYFAVQAFKDFSVPYLGLCCAFIFIAIFALYSRAFALKAQDRAIRAEESLRYFILTGKAFPKTLRMRQILALRFAEDAEFVQLVDRCIFDKLSSDEIKKAIIDWKPDTYRV